MVDRSIWPIKTCAVALEKWDKYMYFVDRAAAEISAVPTFPDLIGMVMARYVFVRERLKTERSINSKSSAMAEATSRPSALPTRLGVQIILPKRVVLKQSYFTSSLHVSNADSHLRKTPIARDDNLYIVPCVERVDVH